jgi:CheY-like chemotaxis protein
MSDLLLDDDIGTLTKDQRECAENIQRSANGLLTVINDILDFSKVESGRLDIEEVQFDLSVVINDVNRMLSFAAERKGLTYIDDIPEIKNWKVMGDPGRLRQVITNLLTNSIKFTSEGSVTISMRVEKETDEMLEVTFIVQDTGIGIEEEVRRRLFKPFSQADSSTARRFGGTGLGLTISKNLVELMHGRISLESTLGVGTKAYFTIPFSKAPYQSGGSGPPLVGLDAIPERLASDLSVSRTSSESGTHTPTHVRKTLPNSDPSAIGSSGVSLSAEHVATDLTPAERKSVNVLVVEDNPINQQIALKTIKKLGFPVKAVWNGQEAIDYLKSPSQDQPPPDVILMDVQGKISPKDVRNCMERLLTLLQYASLSPPHYGVPPISNLLAMSPFQHQARNLRCQQHEFFWHHFTDFTLQMPVMDGYASTHYIRNAKEFRSNPIIQGTPIVAMTASAIQGDREKCQMAGSEYPPLSHTFLPSTAC